MTTQKLVFIAVLAGLGLSACSNTPQSSKTSIIPEADELQSPGTELTNNSPAVSQKLVHHPQVAKGLDLSYTNKHHTPATAAAIPRAYQHHVPQATATVPKQVAYQAAARNRIQRTSIPSYLPNHPPRNTNTNNSNSMPNLSKAELRSIGQQIFVNEGGGNMNRLVHWNVGEDFAAMGIGHFTWYPSKRRQRFGNTFPGLLDFMVSKGVQLPAWLKQARHTGSPWRSRNDFLRDRNSHRVKELQRLLYNTREIQAEYIVNRARRAMPKLVKASSGNIQHHVGRNLNAVANTPGGWYALIDYVNFKGEGLGKGGYKGQSWGLRQVLEEMRPSQPGRQALHEFADAAMRVLHRRVRNSDPKRNEARWLRGWGNRVNTYRNPVV